MVPIKPTKTVFTIANFLDWQRTGSLQLKPTFQRREVWSSKAKSLFIDSVVRGLPVPIIFLRSRQDIKKLKSTFEVVDGQQRLRTLFSFIDPSVLSDYDRHRDDFTVLKVHNKELARRTFSDLQDEIKQAILGYELSTHVLPPDTSDEVVLRIFARMNSTGSKLNHQEIRNSQYFGALKTLCYELAVEALPLWRKWAIFDDNDFARMQEVETTSDLLVSMMEGIQGKTQAKLDKYYREFDDDLPGFDVLSSRFQRVLTAIEDEVGDDLAATAFRRVALFYSLFLAVYDRMYGLEGDYRKRGTARALPSDFRERLIKLNRMIEAGRLPSTVEDAVVKATTDKDRRKRRHDFFIERLALGTPT